ncbi:hypothetical protein PACTADRAFT_49988 [Pachysolen tannophilus NRRL Y-2460]|uniref:Enoyl reductase (ER) domain-containing protein n=1 Tax=Pachysolen tannophilus NRRL Y-2460 TaxID=669874 RepID=A0A1E4TU35_PACTA|nr:hypothetical protein PACTADRAFT_49988 [Pachysolen tannophilus NRRL Y-2460]
MRGLLYYGAKDLRFSKEIPKPTIKNPDDVLVKIGFCGICGTDLHEYEGPIFLQNAATTGDKISNKKLPLTLGHEFSGVVEEVGPGVTHLVPGDHVVVEATGHCTDRHRYKENNPYVNEPKCDACKQGFSNCCKDLNFCGLGVDNGALSEYVVYGASHILKIPRNKVSLDVAALVEPLSVAWHAIELTTNFVDGGFGEGKDALVIGAGPIGLATILCLQGHKAGRIICSEPAKIRRERAAALGAIVFDPSQEDEAQGIASLKKLTTSGAGFDATFDCSGLPITYRTSIHALRSRGVACNVAIWADKPVDHYVMDITLHENYTVGSLGYTTEDFRKVIEKMDSGDIDIEKVKTLITGRIGLENAVQEGFLELINHKDKHIKVLVSPDL